MDTCNTNEAPTSTHDHPLGNDGLPLIPFEAYQQARSHVFPTVESLRWFERQHRTELHGRGALCMPTGRKLVVADRFDAVVMSGDTRN